MAYIIKDTKRVREIEEEKGEIFSGKRFTVLSVSGDSVLGTARVAIGWAMIESIPFWLNLSDIEEVEERKVRIS